MRGLTEFYSSKLRYTTAYAVETQRLVTRQLDIVPSYDQHLQTFSWIVWVTIVLTLIIMSLTFKFLHFVYLNKLDERHNLAGPVVHRLDFVIVTFSSLTEPDPIPWFPKMSAGLDIVLYSYYQILRKYVANMSER